MNYPEAHTDSAPRPRAFLVRSVYLRVLVLGREGPQYGVHLLRRAAIPVTLLPVTGQPMNVLAVVHRFTTFETRSLDCKVLRSPVFKRAPIIHVFVRPASRRQRQGRLGQTVANIGRP